MPLPLPSDDFRYREMLRRIENLETALRGAFTTISGGAGIRIVDGGRLALTTAEGTEIFYIGPVSPNQADGDAQPGWIVRRADGTTVLVLRDQFPSDNGGELNQALNWFDSSGNVVVADDTNAGQGLARPYLQLPFYEVRDGDWPVTTSTAFEAIYRAVVPKQQPRLYVRAWGTGIGSSTGEMRIMVNGAQFGSTASLIAGVVTLFTFGPLAVEGDHMSTLTIELQARMTSGTEGVRCCVRQAQGQQT